MLLILNGSSAVIVRIKGIREQAWVMSPPSSLLTQADISDSCLLTHEQGSDCSAGILLKEVVEKVHWAQEIVFGHECSKCTAKADNSCFSSLARLARSVLRLSAPILAGLIVHCSHYGMIVHELLSNDVHASS